MAFLTLSGFTIPVHANTNGTINMVNVGEFGRAFSGVPYKAVRAQGQEYSGRWPWVPRTTAIMHRLLIEGACEAWRFATSGLESYSSKGLGSFATLGTPTYSATGGPVSSGPRLILDAGERLSYATQVPALNQEATLSLWIKSASTSNTWKHYVIEADGGGVITAWQNGASFSVGSLPNGLGNEWIIYDSLSPTINLGDSGAADEDMTVAEVMMLPFRASSLDSSWPSWAYNSGSGRTAEDFPYLTMGGTWPETGSDVVLGEVGREDLADVQSGGSSTIYSMAEFTLRSRNLTP